MEKIFIIIAVFFTIILFNNSLYAANGKDIDYEKYKKTVEEKCLAADFYTTENNGNKYIYTKFEKYYKSPEELKDDSKVKHFLEESKETFALKASKEIYRENQNNIYKCGIISTQFKGLNLVKNLLNADKTGTAKSLILQKLEPQIKKIEKIAQKESCKIEKNNLKISKKQILDQSTYELCKYIYYLNYLDVYYSNLDNVLGIDTEKLKGEGKKAFDDTEYNSNSIVGLQDNIINSIKIEKEHSYKIYPLAFTAYSEYQSYYPIHITLELLKDNVIIYREKLYKTLSPINQVVYKIIDAMSK